MPEQAGGTLLTPTLWVFQATATAAHGCIYPTGEVHALLAFAVGPDRDAALNRMRSGIADLGWCDETITRSGQIPSDLSTVADSALRSAAEGALEGGCGVIAYAEPITGHAAGRKSN